MREAVLGCLIVLAPALTGCIGPTDQVQPNTTDTVGNETTPNASLSPVQTPEFSDPLAITTIESQTDPDFVPAEEPYLHTGPTGSIYLVTPHVSAMWRSDDAGDSFQRLFDDRTGEGNRTAGNTDAAMANGPNQTLYWAGLGGSEYEIPFQTSSDRGESWSVPIEIAPSSTRDRQWVAGTLEGHVVVTASMDGDLGVRVSHDAGNSFGNVTYPADGFPGDVVVHEPSNTFYIPFSALENGSGVVQVAIGEDGGRNWTIQTATPPVTEGQARVAPIVTNFPMMAVDAKNNLYLVYAAEDPPVGGVVGGPVAGQSVFFTRSLDSGQTWSDPIQLSGELTNAVYPWIEAGDEGRIVVAWYEDIAGPSRTVPSQWYTRVAVSGTAASQSPSFKMANTTEDAVHVGTICNECGGITRLDHLGLTLGPEGYPVVAWAEDGDTNPRNLDIVTSRVTNVQID